MFRTMTAALCLTAGLTAGTARPAGACDLALLFAVDVSGSIDAGEYATQMRGLADALRDYQVAEMLARGNAHIALVQWSGATRQLLSMPWTPIASFTDATRAALTIASMPRAYDQSSTAIGEALMFAEAVFDHAPPCARRVIDVSGDGVSNEGLLPEHRIEALGLAGITVNALVIDVDMPGLTDYFRNRVITGEGAFALRANGWEDYPLRIRQKLMREIASEMAELELPEEFPVLP